MNLDQRRVDQIIRFALKEDVWTGDITSQSIIDELKEKFVDFRKAYDEGGLPVDEFADYGPVQLFRNAFLKGYYQLLAEIAARRHEHAL